MIRDTSSQDTKLSAFPTSRLKAPLVLFFIIFAASSIVWASLSRQTGEMSVEKDQLRFAQVRRDTMIRDLMTNGRVVAANAPVLYSTEEGKVRLIAQPGDKIMKGDTVAIITSPKLRSSLQESESILLSLENSLARTRLDVRRNQLELNKALDIARVELAAADRESRRADKLIGLKLISEFDFEQSKDELDKAKLAFAHAEKESQLMKDTLSFEVKTKELEVERQGIVVAELRRQVKDLEVIAPVDGIIGNWFIEQNARIGKGEPLLTVVDLSAFEVELGVSETYSEELGLGMKVELHFGADKVLGEIASISPEIINREVTTRVRFSQKPKLKLRQNQRLSARVFLEERKDILMIKRGPFAGNASKIFAYKVNGDLAEKIPVQLGVRSLQDIEVISGGAAGDTWIISDYDKLRDHKSLKLR